MSQSRDSTTQPRPQVPAPSDRLVDALILVLVVGYLFGALLTPVFLATHEGPKLYARAMMYQAEMGEGSFPAFFLSDSAYGAGAAFPLFYPPLAYTSAAVVLWAVGDPALGVNLAAFLAVLASAFAMRWLLTEMGATRPWALLAAVAYVAAPYRFGLIYTRGALAESLALAWFPLVVLGIWRLAHHRRYPAMLVAAAALALLSHSITAIYFALCAAAFAVAILPTVRGRGAAMMGLAGLHVAALVAFYVIPVKAYLPLTHGSDPAFIRATAEVVRAHRVEVGQLLASAADVGSGFSLNGPFDGMSFEVGPAPLALFVLLAWIASSRRAQRDPSPLRRGFLAVGFGALALTILFIVAPGLFLPVLPAAFDYIQFPWRLLGQAAFLTALCLGLCGAFLPRRHAGPIAVVILLLIVARVADHDRLPRVVTEWAGNDLSREHAASTDGYYGFTDLGEYVPFSFPAARIRDTIHRPTLVAPDEAGRVEWRRLDYGRWELVASGVARQGATVRLPLLAYPFYSVRSETLSEDNLGEDEGFVALWLPEGNHRAIVERRRPSLVVFSLVASGVALLLLVGIAVVQRAVEARRIVREYARAD